MIGALRVKTVLDGKTKLGQTLIDLRSGVLLNIYMCACVLYYRVQTPLGSFQCLLRIKYGKFRGLFLCYHIYSEFSKWQLFAKEAQGEKMYILICALTYVCTVWSRKSTEFDQRILQSGRSVSRSHSSLISAFLLFQKSVLWNRDVRAGGRWASSEIYLLVRR